jgi:hypothetical protein
MSSRSTLTTKQLRTVFAEEVTARRGQVTDTYDDGRRLFARSVLSQVEEVRPGDRLQGGVALRATDESLWLYPYVFRLVCKNGAIMAQALDARPVARLDEVEPDAVLDALREEVEACCQAEVFTGSVQKIRAASLVELDAALQVLPTLAWISRWMDPTLFEQIMDRYFRDVDRSAYGLGNAITAVARETRDPEVRWNLEEMGGGVLVGNAPWHPVDEGWAAMARPSELLSVG